jgi:hypothetical protein
MREQEVGRVSHYYTRLCVAGVVLVDTLQAGDIVRIHGKHTDFVQRATSIQFNHQPANEAHVGQEIGLLVDFRAHAGDRVYRLDDPEAEALVSHARGDLRRRELER